MYRYNVCIYREEPVGELDMVKAKIRKRLYKVAFYSTSTKRH